MRGCGLVPRLCQPCCCAVARFARLTQPWHTIIPQPGSLKAWPCSTSNRCLAGRANRRSSRCWRPPEWIAAASAASSCTASRPSWKSPTASRCGWSRRWTAGRLASAGCGPGRAAPQRPAARRPSPPMKTTSSGWRGCWTWKAGPRPKRRRTMPGDSRPKRPSRAATRCWTWSSWTRKPDWAAATWSTWAARPPPAALDAAGRRQPGRALAARSQGRATAPRRGLRSRRAVHLRGPGSPARGPGQP